jgi:hypothetical protein
MEVHITEYNLERENAIPADDRLIIEEAILYTMDNEMSLENLTSAVLFNVYDMDSLAAMCYCAHATPDGVTPTFADHMKERGLETPTFINHDMEDDFYLGLMNCFRCTQGDVYANIMCFPALMNTVHLLPWEMCADPLSTTILSAYDRLVAFESQLEYRGSSMNGHNYHAVATGLDIIRDRTDYSINLFGEIISSRIPQYIRQSQIFKRKRINQEYLGVYMAQYHIMLFFGTRKELDGMIMYDYDYVIT